MKEESIENTLNEFKKEIESIEDFTSENIKTAIDNVKEKTGVKGKLLFMPIRIKTTGQMHGPELPVTLKLLGKETILNRLSI